MLEEIVLIAEEAGRRVMAYYRRADLKVEIKDDCSPLTAADLDSHRFITDALRKISPLPIVSEEDPPPYEARREWRALWLVDPLDGTKDFISATDEFTINIALVEDSRPTLGVVAAPALGVCYFAAQGRGAFKQSGAGRVPIRNLRRGEELVCADSRFHSSDRGRAFCARHGITRVIPFGSALKLCKLAEGEIDVYPRFKPTKEWDTAAGQCIAEAGGGKVIDMVSGAPLAYNKESLLNNGFLACRSDLNLDYAGL